MLSKLRFSLFVLFAFVVLFSRVTLAQTDNTDDDNVNTDNDNINTDEDLDIDLDDYDQWGDDYVASNEIGDGWVAVPADLQAIGGDGAGNNYYLAALQLGAQAIADQAVRLGLFANSNSTVARRNSVLFTPISDQVSNYSLGITVQSAENETVDGSVNVLVSNSGNWWVSNYDFSYLARNNDQVDRVKVNFNNNTWWYEVPETNVEAGESPVWDLALPPVGDAQTSDPNLAALNYTPVTVDEIRNNPELLWTVRYAARWVLTQARSNAVLSTEDPNEYDVDWIYSAWTLQTESTRDYQFDIRAEEDDDDYVRILVQVAWEGNADGQINHNLYSWAITRIREDDDL